MTRIPHMHPLIVGTIAVLGTAFTIWVLFTTNRAVADPLSASPAAIVPVASQPVAKIFVEPPLPAQLARGLMVVQYRTENVRILPVYGPAALNVSPRLGHLHLTLDDAPWHWVDASGEPIIVQGLPQGKHKLLVELADPTHHVIDSAAIQFEIPEKQKHPQ